MKTWEHREAEEEAADGSLWLDQYPVDVLEAVLQILKAQRGDHTASRLRH